MMPMKPRVTDSPLNADSRSCSQPTRRAFLGQSLVAAGGLAFP
jgi:hypothetical protein